MNVSHSKGISRDVPYDLQVSFFNVSASVLTSKWFGEGEKMIRSLFSVAKKMQPSVIFIDEFDSIASSRCSGDHEASRRMKTELLIQFDGMSTTANDGVFVLAATNRPMDIDDAALRRFTKRIFVGHPILNSRISLIRHLMQGCKHSISDEDFLSIGISSEGYSSSDIAALCKEAAIVPIRIRTASCAAEVMALREEDIPDVTVSHFDYALRIVRPSVPKENVQAYARWIESHCAE